MPLPATRRALAVACLTFLLAGGAAAQPAPAAAPAAEPAEAPSGPTSGPPPAPEAELPPARTTAVKPPALTAPALATSALPGAKPPPSLDDLLATLEDPAARNALIERLRALQSSAAATAEPTAIAGALDSVNSAIEARVDAVGDAFVGVIGSIRQVPILARWAWLQLSEPITRDLWATVTLQAGTAVLAGLLASVLARLPLRGWRDRLGNLPLATRVGAKIKASLADLMVNLLALTIFLVVTDTVLRLGNSTFLTRLMAGDVLTAVGCVRSLSAVSKALLAPENGRRRLVALDDGMARHLHRWLVWILGLAVYGHYALQATDRLGLPWTVEGFLTHLLFLVVTGLVILQIYRLRGQVSALIVHWGRTSKSAFTRYLPWQGLAAAGHHILAVWVASVFLVWAVGVPDGAMLLTRGLVISLAVLLGLRAFHVWLEWALLPPRAESTDEEAEPAARPAARVAVIAFLRTVAALVAFALVLDAWGIDVGGFLQTSTGREILAGLGRVGIVVAMVLLVARSIKAASTSLVEARGSNGQPIYSNRMRTLILIAANLLVMLLVAGGIVEVLSEIGVNTNALLAGAGVVGLALGFGSQKLVQDLTTGMFILLGDTVRVGDVVDLGGKSGVVEAISMRTITLRAYNGDVHTIPYSSIDVVTNMTKDFSYYVLDVPVAYKENVDQVVEVLKAIDAELRREWPYRRLILEPLEIAGVDAFKDSAVIIKARTKVRPGEQWKVGREFNRRIKQYFDEQGIEIPIPHQKLLFATEEQQAAKAALIERSRPQPAPETEVRHAVGGA